MQTGKGLAERPPFTLADIKNAIPAHCWKKDAWRSMMYLARDVAVVVGMAAAAYSINSWSALVRTWCQHACMQQPRLLPACLFTQ